MPHEPERPVTPPAHEGTTSADEESADELSPEEEPTTTGTLFIMVLFLMALAGMWGIMYFTLLNR
jgi:hypothetical protein